MGWIYKNNYIIPDSYPHETVNLASAKELFGKYKKAVMIRYTTDFDGDDQTQFWYCIKDDLFDINKIKAKRRYEINKGLKNFRTELIEQEKYAEEIFDVYLNSFGGYKEGTYTLTDKEEFIERIKNSATSKAAKYFGVFEVESGRLCGYSDIYTRGKYLPISSLKTIPEYERKGVNFSLVYGIIKYFEDDIKNGCYLCDGARNVMHETNFQDFLIKYFGFRKAFCKINIEYREWFGIIVFILYPFRKLLKGINNRYAKKIYSILKQEAWRRGQEE